MDRWQLQPSRVQGIWDIVTVVWLGEAFIDLLVTVDTRLWTGAVIDNISLGAMLTKSQPINMKKNSKNNRKVLSVHAQGFSSPLNLPQLLPATNKHRSICLKNKSFRINRHSIWYYRDGATDFAQSTSNCIRSKHRIIHKRTPNIHKRKHKSTSFLGIPA